MGGAAMKRNSRQARREEHLVFALGGFTLWSLGLLAFESLVPIPEDSFPITRLWSSGVVMYYMLWAFGIAAKGGFCLMAVVIGCDVVRETVERFTSALRCDRSHG
jgi:hypothetical protein